MIKGVLGRKLQTEKFRINITVPKQLYFEICDQARRDGMKPSQLVRTVLMRELLEFQEIQEEAES